MSKFFFRAFGTIAQETPTSSSREAAPSATVKPHSLAMSRWLFGCSSVPCTAGEPHSAVQGKELSQTVVGPSRQPAVDARAADQAQFRAVRSLVRQPGSGEQRSASRPSLGDEGARKTEAEGPARAPAPSSKCTDLREMIAALRSAHDASPRHRQRERLPLERSPGALTPRPVRGSRRHGGTPSSRKRTEHKKRRCVPDHRWGAARVQTIVTMVYG